MRRAEGGTQAHGIVCSRGGLTTKIHAAVDALGIPVRLIPTAGQRGDSSQTAALIDGLRGVGDVIAGAVYDSGGVRGKIKDELRAETHIKANPSRAIKPPLAPDLYAQRQKVETSSSGSNDSVAAHCAVRRQSQAYGLRLAPPSPRLDQGNADRT